MPSYNTRWRFKSAKGMEVEIPVRGRCTISNALALKQCTLAGMGITLLPQWVVWNELRDGSLIDLFPNHEVTPMDSGAALWLLYPSRRNLPLKVRVLVDYLRNKFRDGAPWESVNKAGKS